MLRFSLVLLAFLVSVISDELYESFEIYSEQKLYLLLPCQ